MKIRATLPILFCLVTVFATGAAVGPEKIFTAEDFARGRVPRCSANHEPTRMLVQINAKLPPYLFTLIAEPVAAAEGTVHRVGRIEISREGKPIQTIEVKSNWDDSVCRLFDAKDVNFDGYLDTSVLREGAGTWASRDYYLFDPHAGRFVTTELTDDLSRLRNNGLRLERKDRQIQAAVLFSRCGGTDIYRIEGGRLVQVQKDEVSTDAQGHRCIETIKQRVDGKWKVVRRKTTKAPEN
jgi:hypothetical protein